MARQHLFGSTMHVLLACAILGLPAAFAHGGDTTRVVGEVAATVNGRPIAKLAAERIAQQIQSQGEQANPDQILSELVNLELLTQQAEEVKLDEREEVATALHLQYTQTMANAYLAHLSEEIDISDEMIRAEYDRQSANLTADEFNASHILLESEEDAQAAIDALQGGADFAEVAKERSTGPSGPSGGELGWFQAANMVPEFANAVIELDVGKMSEAPVQTQFGWHVIKLNDKRGAAKPDFESVKPGIYNSLLRQELAKRVDSLRDNAEIEIK